MKIERFRNRHPLSQAVTLEEFADRHGLVMEVRERVGCSRDFPRFYASFHRAEVKEGGLLVSFAGNGDSEEEAIREYARRLDGKLLVLDATSPARRDIVVNLKSS